MDLIFDVFPNRLIPFDYDTYFSSGATCILTATNCLTGRAAYLTEDSSRERLMAICRASSSLPVISQMVKVDGIPMLDGGLADSVPIRKALHDGVKKNVVILTRQEGVPEASGEEDSEDGPHYVFQVSESHQGDQIQSVLLQ